MRRLRDGQNAFYSLATDSLLATVEEIFAEKDVDFMKDRMRLAHFVFVGTQEGDVWHMGEGCMPGDPATVLVVVVTYARELQRRLLPTADAFATAQSPWTHSWV